MSKDEKPYVNDDKVTMTRGELAALLEAAEEKVLKPVMARLEKVEAVDAGTVANPIVSVTCNSCGQPVNEKGVCPTHPTEMVNHIAIGRDHETGLKRPVIAKQTRAA